MANRCVADVFYVDTGDKGPHASIVNVTKACDGSLYIEINARDLAGQKRTVDWTMSGHIKIDNVIINGGLTHDQVQLLAAA